MTSPAAAGWRSLAGAEAAASLEAGVRPVLLMPTGRCSGLMGSLLGQAIY
jgi:hypothetical protein